MMRIETSNSPIARRATQWLPARIHYDEDWNLFSKVLQFGGFFTSSPYPLWWGLKPVLPVFLPLYPPLPARIHYDEDWNGRARNDRHTGNGFQPVSIMMRIETVRGNSQNNGLWVFQPVSIMMRIETVGCFVYVQTPEGFQPVSIMMRIETRGLFPVNAGVSILPARIHYDEDWNLLNTWPLCTTWLDFQPVSIMMRIETSCSINNRTAPPSSSPYPLWWGLKPASLSIWPM